MYNYYRLHTKKVKIMYKKTLLIDLDGVLNTYVGGYQADFIPPIRQGAKEFLIALEPNFELKLFTTRPAELAQKWLDDNEISHLFTEVTNIKKPAWLLIDDRCLTFNGDYDDLTTKIINFAPWYK